jgi:hypothetical protein
MTNQPIQDTSNAPTSFGTVENPTRLWGLYQTLKENSGKELDRIRGETTSGGLEPMLAICVVKEVQESIEALGKYVKGRDIKESAASALRTLGHVLSVDAIRQPFYPTETQEALMKVRGYFEIYHGECVAYVESTEKRE